MDSTNNIMSTEIATLEHAELKIRRAGIVHDEKVEGQQLLTICGLSYTYKNWGSVVQRQIERHNFLENRDFFVSRISVGGGNNASKKLVNFTISAANHVLFSSMTQEGKRARQEAIDDRLEKQSLRPDISQIMDERFEQPYIQQPKAPVDPHLLLEMNIASTRSAVALAEALGFTGNQKLLSADRLLKSQIGFSPLEAMGQKALSAPVQEMTFTPTQLGQMMTPPTNPREVNNLLEAAGMQNKLDTQWIPTEQGMEFCEILDTGKAHNNGTPVKQVKWYKSVLKHLLTPSYSESSDNQDAIVPEGVKMADPDKEPLKSRPGRKLRPGLTRNSIRKRGRYDLGNYFSVVELADELELTKGYVTEVLEKNRIIKWKGNGKAGKYIFTEKGWHYGLMYNPSEKEFHNQHSKRLMTTNCQPVFDCDILDLF